MGVPELRKPPYYVPDVCSPVEAALSIRQFWKANPQLTPDAAAVPDILWSAPADLQRDLIANMEDSTCVTTRHVLGTAKHVLVRKYHWSETLAEVYIDKLLGTRMHIVEAPPMSTIRRIALEEIRPRIEEQAPELLADLDPSTHRAEQDDVRVDLEDLIVLAQVDLLRDITPRKLNFASADKRCAAAGALIGIADTVTAYRQDRHTGGWYAHDLPVTPQAAHTLETDTPEDRQLKVPLPPMLERATRAGECAQDQPGALLRKTTAQRPTQSAGKEIL